MVYSGINIQYPISRLIVGGTKTIETRTYPIPKEYIGQKLLLIETPGTTGSFKARIIGTVVFGESFEYRSRSEFYKDSARHCVTPDSPWKWNSQKPKFGWPVLKCSLFAKPYLLNKRKGIKFTRNICLEALSTL